MQWIKHTLSSIRNLNEKYETIVVDNNSQDNTVQFIEKNFPEVLLVKENKNHGFGKANNIGIKKALVLGADYVFLLNQDAYLESNTIEELLKVFNTNEKIGVASPIHLNGNGSALDKLFSTYVAPKLSNDPCLFMSDSYNLQLSKYYEVDFVNAAAWLLSRECIEKIGLFDPLFYHYGEDVNYCQRLKYFNYKLVIVPESRIYHDREDRIVQMNNSLEFKKRSLLIELANIELNDTYFIKRISYLKKYYLRIFILHILRNRFDKAKENLILRRFLIKNISKIKESRKINRNEG
jgi:GT2 family glycosyltransferase